MKDIAAAKTQRYRLQQLDKTTGLRGVVVGDSERWSGGGGGIMVLISSVSHAGFSALTHSYPGLGLLCTHYILRSPGPYSQISYILRVRL